MSSTASVKRMQVRRLSAGQCIKCGHPNSNGFQICDKCKKPMSDRKRAKRLTNKENGLCNSISTRWRSARRYDPPPISMRAWRKRLESSWTGDQGG